MQGHIAVRRGFDSTIIPPGEYQTKSGKVCIRAPFYVKRRSWWGKVAWIPVIREDRLESR